MIPATSAPLRLLSQITVTTDQRVLTLKASLVFGGEARAEQQARINMFGQVLMARSTASFNADGSIRLIRCLCGITSLPLIVASPARQQDLHPSMSPERPSPCICILDVVWELYDSMRNPLARIASPKRIVASQQVNGLDSGTKQI